MTECNYNNEFSPEEIEAALEARRAYNREQKKKVTKDQKRLYNMRYWVKRAKQEQAEQEGGEQA